MTTTFQMQLWYSGCTRFFPSVFLKFYGPPHYPHSPWAATLPPLTMGRHTTPTHHGLPHYPHSLWAATLPPLTMGRHTTPTHHGPPHYPHSPWAATLPPLTMGRHTTPTHHGPPHYPHSPWAGRSTSPRFLLCGTTNRSRCETGGWSSV